MSFLVGSSTVINSTPNLLTDGNGSIAMSTTNHDGMRLKVQGYNAEAYGTTASSKYAFLPKGSQENHEVSSGATSKNGIGYLINLTVNDNNGGDSAYIGAVGQSNTNSGAHIVFGRRTGATSWAESARIDASGNLLVGVNSASYHVLAKPGVALGSVVFEANNTDWPALIVQASNSTGYNAANTTLKVSRNNTTVRSINAAGTVNASGADYAEYMVKAGDFEIAKGDVCGVDANGKLTNVYADAVTFVVKSTDPSYVGGDSWGIDFKDDPEGLEAARQKVDRIAFSGQVPVNVLGATPGQYIIPVNDNGAIKGEAVSNPTFEQYLSAVGKVIAIEDDGRARIFVKVV